MPRKGEFAEVVGYVAAHKRVKSRYGPAAAHDCIDCGQAARDWAYNHADPGELVGDSAGKAVPYSLDPENYDPLCRPCHTRRDMGLGDICKHGHLLTDETLYVDKRGWRSCKVCRSEARQAFKERKAA